MVRASHVRDLEGRGPQVERLASGVAEFLPDDGDAEGSCRGGSGGLRELRRVRTAMRLPRRHAPDGPGRRRGALGGAIGLLRAGRGLCFSRVLGDDRIIRSLPEATSNRTRPLILLPLGRAGRASTRRATRRRTCNKESLVRLRGRTGRRWQTGRRVLRGAAR